MNGLDEKLLRVGELAKAVGKTVRAVHLYEELGLVKPTQRSDGGYRLFGDDAVERVRWIAKLQDMGFSLPEIQGLLKDWARAANGRDGMSRIRAVFTGKLKETHETIERLVALERDLRASLAYLESCGACEPAREQCDCVGCGENGHDPHETPGLVAGLAGDARWDVDVSQLTGDGR